MDEDDVQIYNNQGVAELIATPNDIDIQTLNKHFPFINKVMSLSNLQENDIMDVKDLMFIQNIQKRSRMTRLQKQKFSRIDNTAARAYHTASITLGRDGFAVKRITSSYKSIQMTEGEGKKRGMLGGLLTRKGGSD